MWEKEIIDIGRVNEKEKIRVVFKYTGDKAPQKVQIQTSCGCTGTKWLEKSNELYVSYTAGKVPKHLTDNQAGIRKSVKMSYICNGEKKKDTLIIKGTVIKKM